MADGAPAGRHASLRDAFEPPSEGSQPPTDPRAFALVGFVVRRLIRLVLLPTLVGALVALVRQREPWVGVVSGVVVALAWLPTTAILAWTRFLAPRTDPSGVVLVGGERFDRDSYRLFARAGAVDRALAAVMLLALAGTLARWGGSFAWLGVAAVAFGLWSLLALRGMLLLAEAAIALAGHDAPGALHEVEKLARWPFRDRGGRDFGRVLAAQAYVRLGQADAALSELGRVGRLAKPHADVVRAQILVSRGDLGPARRLIAKAEPMSIARETTFALLAIHEDAPERILARERAWDPLRAQLTDDLQGALDLYVAVALEQSGDHAAAHERIAKVPDVERRRWVAAIWPKVGELMAKAESRAGKELEADS